MGYQMHKLAVESERDERARERVTERRTDRDGQTQRKTDRNGDETHHRMCGGSVSLSGVCISPAEHIASKLNHSTLQAEANTCT